MRPDAYNVCAPARGELYIMPRPRSGEWLTEELSGLRTLGIELIVSLLEVSEAYELGLAEEEAEFRALGGQFVQFPIEDRSLPANRMAFSELVVRLRDCLREGESVAVHCRAGIGRSGTLVSCVLIALGCSPAVAISQVSQARGLGIPDTPAQTQFIRAYQRSDGD